MPIIISKDGKNAEKIEKSDIQKEDYLQEYIHNNPESIPVYELNEDKKLFVVKREFSTNAGSIDALAIDKDGDIYIVETKLYKNPDKRTVVAQALDYGAALWKHFNDFSEFIRILDEECQKKFDLSLSEKIQQFFQLDGEGAEHTLDAMRKNLNDGNLKFVILMDAIGTRLKDLILYVNQNSQFDIYAVQLEYYKFKDYEIMIPKIFGVEVKKNITTSKYSQRKYWDKNNFKAQTRELLGGESDKIFKLYDFFRNNSEKINWGTGVNFGSFSPIINKIDETIALFTVYSNGKFEVKFNWIYEKTGKSNIKDMADIFFRNIIDKGININKSCIEMKETFRLQPKEFLENYEGIVRAIKKIVEEYK